MVGKIIKGIAGFYYIHPSGLDETHNLSESVYECKAKGIFRNKNIKPLVGDNVEFDVLDENKKKGNILKVLDRTNQLIRPAVSNIDQALVIFATAQPEPSFNLLDRFLLSMEIQGIKSLVCFNKMEIVSGEQLTMLQDTYQSANYNVLFTSALNCTGLANLKSLLLGKTTVLAGPSGVGKSSLMNELIPNANMEVGAISQKIERGKHTTRHTELFCMGSNTYLMDTPGFSSLYLDSIEKEDLKTYFPEFAPYQGMCRFTGCIHIHEPGCAIKVALGEGKLSKQRYDNYMYLFNELKEKRKY